MYNQLFVFNLTKKGNPNFKKSIFLKLKKISTSFNELQQQQKLANIYFLNLHQMLDANKFDLLSENISVHYFVFSFSHVQMLNDCVINI